MNILLSLLCVILVVVSTTTSTTASWSSNYDLQQVVTKIFLDTAPQLTQTQLQEIMKALQNMNTYTQYWTASQVFEISKRNSLIVQENMVAQNTCLSANMIFSHEVKEEMIKYTKELNPNMSMEDILGEISVVEEIGTACMRYLTLEQYKQLRGEVVLAFANASTTPCSTASTTTALSSSSSEHNHG
ncbi:hypothetical protein ACKWTF_003214 [Chironomus riparius]